MTQTFLVRAPLELWSRLSAVFLAPIDALDASRQETDDFDLLREEQERRRHQEYLYWGFSPYSTF